METPPSRADKSYLCGGPSASRGILVGSHQKGQGRLTSIFVSFRLDLSYDLRVDVPLTTGEASDKDYSYYWGNLHDVFCLIFFGLVERFCICLHIIGQL